jgi:hypothetical protein
MEECSKNDFSVLPLIRRVQKAADKAVVAAVAAATDTAATVMGTVVMATDTVAMATDMDMAMEMDTVEDGQ